MCTLCAPAKPEECTYETLKTKLNSRLASTCQWSEGYLADNLRDKFVMGLRNERLLQQLLTQDHTKSLDNLFQLAITFEAAERETVQRSQTNANGTDSSVSAVKNPRPYRGTQNKQPQSGLPRKQQNNSKQQTRNQQTHKCASCGGDYARKTCKFYNVKCHHCGRMGHIARVCGSKIAVVTQQQPDESAVVPISQRSKQFQNDILPMFQILHLTEMQKRLRLMVDSASPIAFINVKTWQDL